MLGYQRATWVVIGLWALFCAATLNYNGPFLDEAIYVTGGVRTLEGHGLTDGYSGWFTGLVFFWPVLAAIGYKVAGLIGTRAMAVIVATGGFIAIVMATKNLFGQRAGFWAAPALAVNGAFLALARLGVHDVPALTGLAVSFWALTELHKADNRTWLGVAAGAFALGLFSKYPMGLMLLPILGIILVLRERAAITDITIFGLISLAIALAIFLPLREQLGPVFGWRAANKPEFGISVRQIGFASAYLSVAPFLLALGGWFVLRNRRRLASVLLLSLAIWPAYHILTRDPTSVSKHLVFGYALATPLAGVALAALWERRIAFKLATVAIVLALTALGLVQLRQFNQAWPDVRETAAYLVEHVQPGEKLLIGEAWPYAMYLYTAGKIDSPWDVFDVYRITHGESEIGLCNYAWFVNVRGSYQWPESIEDEIARCGRFEQVLSKPSTVIGLGPDLHYVTYEVYINIQENTEK